MLCCCGQIDPERKCPHANLVTARAGALDDEWEYLFAPYSAFTVRAVRWSAGDTADPHVIDLDAAPDNMEVPEDVPLAPWG